MKYEIERLLSLYEAGNMTRRELVTGLGFLAAAVAGGQRAFSGEKSSPQSGTETPSASTFQATGLDHIALRVTDVARSRDFYMKHLGLRSSGEGGNSAFLYFGRDFLALFRSGEAGLDHYCYAVKDYDVAQAEKKLRAAGLQDIRRTAGRIYFSDPDGLTVQLAAEHE